MKIECIKDNLLIAVNQTERVTGKNLTLPVLSTILFEAKNSSLTLRATNLDLGIEVKIQARIIKEGRIAVKGNILAGFLSNLKNDRKIILEKKEETLVVSSETSKATLKIHNHEEFPSIPSLSQEQILNVDSNNFAVGLKSVWYSASNSHIKPELSSVLVYSEGETVVFAATDSFRLAEKKMRMKKPRELNHLLIPLKNIPEIIRLSEEGDDNLEVRFDKNQISFTKGNIYLVSRLVDGVFPDYRQIIPHQHKTEAVVLKEDIVRSLKIATVFSDSFGQITFHLVPNKKIFEVKARNIEIGENSSLVPGAFEGEPLDISFNHRYLLDCFQSINADSVLLSFSDNTKPAIIRGVADQSFTYLVMPMNR